jgi:hypothetical protein
MGKSLEITVCDLKKEIGKKGISSMVLGKG